jgi:hypothetical protein
MVGDDHAVFGQGMAHSHSGWLDTGGCSGKNETFFSFARFKSIFVSMKKDESRLRLARQVRQEDAALRAGMTLLQLLEGKDPSLVALEASEKRQRVRELTPTERLRLDF